MKMSTGFLVQGREILVIERTVQFSSRISRKYRTRLYWVGKQNYFTLSLPLVSKRFNK